MHIIQIVPCVRLLRTVYYRTDVGLLAAENRRGREEGERNEPEDNASTSRADFCALTRCKSPMRNRVKDHRRPAILIASY